MRPLRLDIEGLTSFRERQQIDFSEFGLFVITGPTGSGKSSILDAITLALYGEVHRANRTELKDLITLGSTQTRIQLDFEVDGTRYRVARRLPRFGAQKAAIEREEGGAWYPEVETDRVREANQRIEEIVGLDFPAFTKAVLLPQGAFSAFLKGDTRERREILVRLLELSRYERAGERAREMAKTLRIQAESLHAVIDKEYHDATEEALRELEAHAVALQVLSEKLERVYASVVLLVSAAGEAQAKAQQVTEELAHLRANQQRLEDLRNRWAVLQPALQAALEAAQAVAARMRAAEQTAAQARLRVDETQKQTGDLAALTRLVDAAAQYEKEAQRMAALAEEIGVAAKGATHAREWMEQAVAEADRRQDQETRTRHDEETARQAREQAQRVLESAQAKAELEQALTDAQKACDSAREAVQEAEARAVQAADRAEEARLQATHVRHTEYAAALRADLKPGDRCPVCEVVVGHVPTGGAQARQTIERAEAAYDRARNGYEAETHNVQQARAHLHVAEAALQARGERLHAVASAPSLEQAQAARAACNKSFDAAARHRAEAETARQAADAAREQAKIEFVRSEERASRLRSQHTDAQQRLETARAVIREAFPDEFPADLANQVRQRQARLTEAHNALNVAEEALTNERTAKTTVDESYALEKQRADAFKLEFVAARTRCTTSAEAFGQRAVASVPEPPAVDEDTTAHLNDLRAWLAGVIDEGTRILGVLNEAQAAKAGQVLAVLRQAEVTASSTELAGVADEVHEMLNATRAEAEQARRDALDLKRRIAKKAELTGQCRKDEARSGRYNELGSELRADRFIAFVLEESLEQLAALASEELRRISAGRFSLAVHESNFSVIDHVNADEERSVATLSGGETFLASLSLALALAASITELVGQPGSRLDAIFIDEGFGSLDPDTLDVVVDALERLQEGDRMVGVITHVPLLAERIPAGLVVERSGGASSVVVANK